MKQLIRELLHDKERGSPFPLVFVSFIGGSKMEVLVDKKIAPKAITIIRELGHSYIKEGIDPLSRLVRKPTANAFRNIALTNARKCKERAEVILRKFFGPEVIDHYTKLLERADAIIAEEEAKDTNPATPAPGIATPRIETPETEGLETPAAESKETAPPAAEPAKATLPAAEKEKQVTEPAAPQLPPTQDDKMEGVTNNSTTNATDGEAIAK